MEIISTNIGKPTTVDWRGRKIQTGIYKYPTKEPITVKREDVKDDTVIDRKHHGGEYKACYLFSADYYDDWKEKYPQLDWDWGMFGENLTVKGLNENELFIGDIYNIGNATIQITEPRQPCHKLGIRFKDQKVIKEFIAYGHPGTYVRILKEGSIKNGDSFTLIKTAKNRLSVQQYNILINSRTKDLELIKLAVDNDSIRAKKRAVLRKLI